MLMKTIEQICRRHACASVGIKS